MKNIKKILAMLMATAMVLSSGVVTFGNEQDPPAEQTPAPTPRYEGDQHYDTAWSGEADNAISVKGLKQGDLVTFYRVLDYDQNASSKIDEATSAATGAASWKAVAPFASMTLDDFKAILKTGITSEIAGRIAAMATSNPAYSDVPADASGVATQATPGAGLYVAIIKPAVEGMMYNPIFVASDYYSTTGGDQSNNWTVVPNALSYKDEAMAKVEEVTVDKSANDSNSVDTEKTNYDSNSETVNVGDTIDFTVETKIPEFGDNYVDASYVVTDTLSTGLQLLNADETAAASNSSYSIKVEIKAAAADGDDTADAAYKEIKATDTFAYTPAGGTATTANPFTVTATATGYSIEFNKYYLLEQLDSLTDLKITYKAKILDAAAATSVNEEDNKVVVTFNNNPNDANSKTKLFDQTNHYTFNIDGNLLGEHTGYGRTTEAVKVGIDENGKEIIVETSTLHQGQTSYGPLSGAKFKLYKDNGSGGKGDAYTNSILTADTYIASGTDGRLNVYKTSDDSLVCEGIKGLDAGKYVLEETEAPAGYIKHQELITIEINPTFENKTVKFDHDDDENTPALEKEIKVLKTYEVLIDGNKTANYTITNAEDGDATSASEGDDVTGADTAGRIGADGATAAAGYGKITNIRGTELPSTGGVGTTMMYMFGAIFVMFAGVLLVSKRRMAAR